MATKLHLRRAGGQRYLTVVRGIPVTIEKSPNPNCYPSRRWSAMSAGFPAEIVLNGFTLKDLRRKLETANNAEPSEREGK